jgi:hypothetical protein
MNYAEDRLDRQARDDPERLWCHCCSLTTHGKLATLWRNIGWNRHAVFHYSQAITQHQNHNHHVGDYAQMAEFAGFPEIAMLILLAYRSNCNFHPSTCDIVNLQRASRDASWLQQSADLMDNKDCGCGMVECGKSPCHIAFSDRDLEPVFSALNEYNRARLQMIRRRQQSTERTEATMEDLMTAHQIIGVKFLDLKQRFPEKQDLDLSESISPPIPPLLQFWKQNNAYRSLSPVLQLLLLKLLYMVLPSLAIEATVYMDMDEEILAKEYKSHWAYFLLIRSLVLGERMKPHRRKLQKYHHIPLWDRLWKTGVAIYSSDQYTLQYKNNNNNNRPSDLVPRLQALISFLRGFDHDKNNPLTPNLVWEPSFDDETPLFLMGDSHVLSLAWQTIQVPNHSDAFSRERVIVPLVVTGLKAWHVRPHTRFFTHTNLRIALQRLTANKRIPQTILVSAGEIDCREGMGGPLLQGYRESFHHVVQNTAREYVLGLYEMFIPKYPDIQILVMPVAPHLQCKTGRAVSRESRLETMRVWNQELRQLLPYRNAIYFLDYVDELLARPRSHSDDGTTSYTLNPVFNADSTHLNSAFAPLLQQSLETCGCDLNKL